MGLSWAENPAQARPAVMPYRHALVEADDPRRDEDQGHMFVEGLNNVADLPDLVGVDWRSHGSGAEVAGDRVKATLQHEGV